MIECISGFFIDADTDPDRLLTGNKLFVLGPSKGVALSEDEVSELIAALRDGKEMVWPKPVKPLCPASASLLTYLKLHDDVTPIKAREELGIEHLPRRIKDLKEHGHTIRTEIKRGFAGKRYAHYVLVKPQYDHTGKRIDSSVCDPVHQ